MRKTALLTRLRTLRRSMRNMRNPKYIYVWLAPVVLSMQISNPSIELEKEIVRTETR